MNISMMRICMPFTVEKNHFIENFFMSGVKALEDATVDRICASQVIPNIHSCIRELVENSLDAEANSLSIRIRNSGFELEVADNGHGINESDWKNLCQPHSTSKIRKFDDILDQCVQSHGFRGEALSALCLLSNEVRIITRTEDMNAGRILLYDSACNVSYDENRVSKSIGTTITVVGLFENSLPVRFLESKRTFKKELKLITNLLIELALINPEKQFELLHEGKSLLNSPGGLSDSFEVYKRILHGDDLVSFTPESVEGVGVSGWISRSSCNSSRDNMQFLFLNKRPINPIKRLTKLILNVFSKYNIKHVSWILTIHLKTGFDLNCHVNKREVLFEAENTIIEIVQNHLAVLFRERVTSAEPLEMRSSFVRATHIESDVPLLIGPVVTEPNAQKVVCTDITLCEELSPPRGMILQLDKSMFMHMEILGQFNNGFIITKIESQLYLVDQHAANEKYLFEHYNDNIVVKPQCLIVPIKVKINPSLEDLILEYKEELETSGFKTEYFPLNQKGLRFQLLTLPTLSGIGFNRSASLSVSDFLSIISIMDNDADWGGFGKNRFLKLLPSVRNMFASKACRTAVMVGDSLTPNRMQEIVKSLTNLHQPWNCPHGRPTIKHLLDISDIEKMHFHES